MRLEKHQIAAVAFAPRLKKVVKAGFKQICCAGIAGNMPSQFGRAAGFHLVGPHHHRQRIPAHEGGQSLLNRQITGEFWLLINGDGVDIRRTQLGLPADALYPRLAGQGVQNLLCPLGTFSRHQGRKSILPFGGFLGIGVWVGSCHGAGITGLGIFNRLQLYP